MEQQSKPIFNMEQLEENFNIFLSKEKTNMKLINHISLEFAKRGLKMSIPKFLFENNLEYKDLNESEIISFLDIAWEYYSNNINDNTEEHILNIKPSLYFYINKINENRMMQPIKKEKRSTLTFPNTIKINDREFQTVLSAKDIYDLDTEGNLVYLKDIQRASKIVKLPNGQIIKRENYNKEGLIELENRFLDKNNPMCTTQISLTIIRFNNKTPIIDYDDKNLVFTFKPDFNPDSENYSFLTKNDGAHRISSLVNAYSKDNTIDVKLSVMIRILTLDQSKMLTVDSFKSNETDSLYLKTMNDTPTDKFVNTLIDNSIFYKDMTAKSSQEEKMEEMYASYNLIKETVKTLNINMKSELMANIKAKKISNKIDDILELLADNYNNDKNKMKIESNLLDKNMCVLYVLLANKIQNESDEKLLEVVSNVFDNKDKAFSISSLKSIENIIEKFNDFIKEIA